MGGLTLLPNVWLTLPSRLPQHTEAPPAVPDPEDVLAEVPGIVAMTVEIGLANTTLASCMHLREALATYICIKLTTKQTSTPMCTEFHLPCHEVVFLQWPLCIRQQRPLEDKNVQWQVPPR